MLNKIVQIEACFEKKDPRKITTFYEILDFNVAITKI